MIINFLVRLGLSNTINKGGGAPKFDPSYPCASEIKALKRLGSTVYLEWILAVILLVYFISVLGIIVSYYPSYPPTYAKRIVLGDVYIVYLTSLITLIGIPGFILAFI